MAKKGVDPTTAILVIDRDGQCVARATHPGKARPGEQIHHRKARKMGGTTVAETNLPANLIYLCRQCHEWIESHRTEALEHGWLVRADHEPFRTPLSYLGNIAYLNDDAEVVAFVDAPWDRRA